MVLLWMVRTNNCEMHTLWPDKSVCMCLAPVSTFEFYVPCNCFWNTQKEQAFDVTDLGLQTTAFPNKCDYLSGFNGLTCVMFSCVCWMVIIIITAQIIGNNYTCIYDEFITDTNLQIWQRVHFLILQVAVFCFWQNICAPECDMNGYIPIICIFTPEFSLCVLHLYI